MMPKEVSTGSRMGARNTCASTLMMRMGARSGRGIMSKSTSKGVVEHVVRALLAYHQRRSIGVGRDHVGHDGGINHAQAGNAVHFQCRVDHGLDIGTHAAGTDGVKDGAAAFAGEIDKVCASFT